MCIICSQWQLGKLTNREALRNASEYVNVIDGDEELRVHMSEVMNKAADAEATRILHQSDKNEATEEELKLL